MHDDNDKGQGGVYRRQLLTMAGGALGAFLPLAVASAGTAHAETYRGVRVGADGVRTLSQTQPLGTGATSSASSDVERLEALQAAVAAYDKCYHVWLAPDGIGSYSFPEGSTAQKGLVLDTDDTSVDENGKFNNWKLYWYEK